MGIAKGEMSEFQEAEMNEYEEMRDADLSGQLENLNTDINVYFDDIKEQLDYLLSDDIDDEFEKETLFGATQEISNLAESKNKLLDQIARYEELKNKFNK